MSKKQTDKGLRMVGTYLTDGLKDKWKKHCFKHNMSSADYIRRLICYEIGIDKCIGELERIDNWKPVNTKNVLTLEVKPNQKKIENRIKKANKE